MVVVAGMMMIDGWWWILCAYGDFRSDLVILHYRDDIEGWVVVVDDVLGEGSGYMIVRIVLILLKSSYFRR